MTAVIVMLVLEVGLLQTFAMTTLATAGQKRKPELPTNPYITNVNSHQSIVANHRSIIYLCPASRDAYTECHCRDVTLRLPATAVITRVDVQLRPSGYSPM